MQVVNTRLAHWLTSVILESCVHCTYSLSTLVTPHMHMVCECFTRSLLICSLSGAVHLCTLHKYSVKWGPVAGHISIRSTCTYTVLSFRCTLPMPSAVNDQYSALETACWYLISGREWTFDGVWVLLRTCTCTWECDLYLPLSDLSDVMRVKVLERDYFMCEMCQIIIPRWSATAEFKVYLLTINLEGNYPPPSLYLSTAIGFAAST